MLTALCQVKKEGVSLSWNCAWSCPIPLYQHKNCTNIKRSNLIGEWIEYVMQGEMDIFVVDAHFPGERGGIYLLLMFTRLCS